MIAGGVRTFDRMPGMGRHPPPLLLGEHRLFFFISPLQLLDALVVVVDGGGEGAFGAFLAHDEGV